MPELHVRERIEPHETRVRFMTRLGGLVAAIERAHDKCAKQNKGRPCAECWQGVRDAADILKSSE